MKQCDMRTHVQTEMEMRKQSTLWSAPGFIHVLCYHRHSIVGMSARSETRESAREMEMEEGHPTVHISHQNHVIKTSQDKSAIANSRARHTKCGAVRVLHDE